MSSLAANNGTMAPGIPARVRVPRFTGGGQIERGERDVPLPGPGQLLIAVRSNAICGTERQQYQDGSVVTPGHETAGVVVAKGPETVTAVGTAGVVYLMDYCGECRSCRIGATNQCLEKRADMGFTHDGGYGPYELVHETNFFPISDDVPLADAPLLLDVMGTSSHAIARARAVHPDPVSLLVAGAGPVGLGVAAMAHLIAPDITVFVSDIVPFRLRLVERLGAQALEVTEQTLGEEFRRRGQPEVDIVIDTTGRESARQQALAVLAQRGIFVCVGHGERLVLSVSSDVIAPERSILGSEYFRYDELPANLALLRANHAFLAQIITHRFSVREISAAFRTFFAGNTGKVLVEQ